MTLVTPVHMADVAPIFESSDISWFWVLLNHLRSSSVTSNNKQVRPWKTNNHIQTHGNMLGYQSTDRVLLHWSKAAQNFLVLHTVVNGKPNLRHVLKLCYAPFCDLFTGKWALTFNHLGDEFADHESLYPCILIRVIVFGKRQLHLQIMSSVLRKKILS